MLSPFFMYLFIGTCFVFYPINSYGASEKQIIANQYVRLIHSTGCIYSLLPILYQNSLTIIDINHTPIPEEVIRVFDRTISFFLWDCIALLISNETDKPLFIAHHLLSVGNIGISRYFGLNWYLMCLALFLGEITNPLTQISEFYEITNEHSIAFEKVYFYSMIVSRGLFVPMIIIGYIHNIHYHYRMIRNMVYLYQLNLLFNLVSMNLITIGSVTWLHKKYLVLYKNNNDKKMS
jgi:hypothetical protein